MSPTATLDPPQTTDSTEGGDFVVATVPTVTREDTIRQIMQEAQVGREKAEVFLDEMLRITQTMQEQGQTARHFTRKEIGELHGPLKIVMKANVGTPDEGTAHSMINCLAFPDKPTLGLMHTGSRDGTMMYCDAAIVTIGV